MAAGLDRSLTLTQLTFYGVGTIVGAGIYSVIGAAAGEAGAGLWLSFLAATVAALLTALSYAELASMHSKAGAEYQFVKAAFPDATALAFLAGFLIALNAAATAATVALAFAGYLAVFVAVPALPTALALLTLCTVINIAGIRQSTSVSIGLICIEVAGLLLLIGGGFLAGDNLGEVTRLPETGLVSGVLSATALLFFMYIGFEDIANLSEEALRPTRDVPRALLASVAITSVIYVAVAFAVLAVVPPETLAQSQSPLTTAGAAIAPWLGTTLAVTALFATASTALIALISISRLLFGMARDGDMPSVLARTWSGRRTPWVAALVLFGAACLLLPLGEVKIVASVSALGVLLVFGLIQVVLIRLRYTAADRERPFRVPGAIGRFPLLPAVTLVIIAVLVTQFEPVVYAVAGGAAAAGLLVHALQRRAAAV